MATLGYPGTFPGALTTGYINIGGVQKQKTSTTLGYPGAFPGGLTTGYLGMGAVQKDIASVGGTAVKWQSMSQWSWPT